jgi:hypothetical protein
MFTRRTGRPAREDPRENACPQSLRAIAALRSWWTSCGALRVLAEEKNFFYPDHFFRIFDPAVMKG